MLNEYPNARWIWEAPNAFELIELGEEVYILLNRAGGYRKAKVIIQNLQVIGLQYQEIPKKPDESEERTEAPATEQPKENYELIAFEWAESHIFELNARCNDAIGQGLTEIILTAFLPVRAGRMSAWNCSEQGLKMPYVLRRESKSIYRTECRKGVKYGNIHQQHF